MYAGGGAGGDHRALDMLGNWDSAGNDFNGDGDYDDTGKEVARDHNFANEIEAIGVIPFAYDKAGNMTEQGLPATATKEVHPRRLEPPHRRQHRRGGPRRIRVQCPALAHGQAIALPRRRRP